MTDTRRDAQPAFPPVLGLPGLRRCRVMGVVNVTPDSFSDGGVAWPDPEDAIRHGLALLTAGADILDIGGESTRPGASRVDAEEEWRRIAPVIAGLAAAGAVISVDTMRAQTAERALGAGALIVNDVSGGLADPAMGRLVAEARVPYVAMHWRGHSRTMNQRAGYADVVEEVCTELSARMAALVELGVDPAQLLVDPGLGFAKRAEHNWQLLASLDRLLALGRPLVIGASRKSFLGKLLASPPGEERPVDGRDAATTAISAIVARAGAWAVRVHDVAGSADAVRVAVALQDAT